MDQTSSGSTNPIVGRENHQPAGDHNDFVEPIVEKLEPNSGRAHFATGPRTQQGKQRSKLNSLKHGLYSKAILLKSESREEYESLLSGLREDFQPQGEIEEALVEGLAVNFWRKRRLLSLENAEFSEMASTNRARVITLEACLSRVEAHLSREFGRTLFQLERRQRNRMDQMDQPTRRIDVETVKALPSRPGLKADGSTRGSSESL